MRKIDFGPSMKIKDNNQKQLTGTFGLNECASIQLHKVLCIHIFKVFTPFLKSNILSSVWHLKLHNIVIVK